MKVEEQHSYPDLTRPLGVTVPHSWLLPFPRPLVLCSPFRYRPLPLAPAGSGDCFSVAICIPNQSGLRN